MSQSQLSEQTRSFLGSCSQEQLREMLAIINARGATLKTTMQNRKPAGITKRSATGRTTLHGTGAKTTRPLNSWMAFRAYYSPIFTSHQQKDISGLLRKLWKTEPFQGTWTILAKAYSLIRDQKGNMFAPLDLFLTNLCPQVGVIAPEEYLNRLGWQLVTVEGSPSLSRTTAPDPTRFHLAQAPKNWTTTDILTFCKQSPALGCEDIVIPSANESMLLAGRREHHPSSNRDSHRSPDGSAVPRPHLPLTPHTLIVQPTDPENGFTGQPDQVGLGIAPSQAEHGAYAPARQDANVGNNTYGTPGNAINLLMPPHFGEPATIANLAQTVAPQYMTAQDYAFDNFDYAHQLVPGANGFNMLEPLGGDNFDAYNASSLCPQDDQMTYDSLGIFDGCFDLGADQGFGDFNLND